MLSPRPPEILSTLTVLCELTLKLGRRLAVACADRSKLSRILGFGAVQAKAFVRRMGGDGGVAVEEEKLGDSLVR